MKKDITPPRLHRAPFGGVEFEFIGGDPVLDFHNTIAWPRGRKSNERLRRPVDFIRWAERAGVITEREARDLRSVAIRNYSRASAILDDALRARDVLRQLLMSVADETPPDAKALEDLNRRQIKAMASVEIKWHDGRLQWAPRADPRMTTILDRVVWRAGVLLSSNDVKRLRRCANPDCGWLFLDRSKNGTRRWCSMRECGDRAKSKRYYQRERKKE
jgi:predicted RNA-binding Zn ribbon-like protein